MRCFVLILLLLGGWSPAAWAKPASSLPRAELVNVMQGDYVVVGKRPDSNTTYSGRLTFRPRGETLAERSTTTVRRANRLGSQLKTRWREHAEKGEFSTSLRQRR